MCFLGGSGRSVKIVCRGELFEGGLPKGEKDIRQFHFKSKRKTNHMEYWLIEK